MVQILLSLISSINWVKKKISIDPSRIYLAGYQEEDTWLFKWRDGLLTSGQESVRGFRYRLRGLAQRMCQIWKKIFQDLEKSCGGKPGDNPQVNEQYKKRSPRHGLMASKVPLDINAGITDGHTGSVPISHSLKAFNLLAEAPDKITGMK